jgi:hypothetical protein
MKNTLAEEILLSNREEVFIKKKLVTKIPKPHQSIPDIDPTSR